MRLKFQYAGWSARYMLSIPSNQVRDHVAHDLERISSDDILSLAKGQGHRDTVNSLVGRQSDRTYSILST